MNNISNLIGQRRDSKKSKQSPSNNKQTSQQIQIYDQLKNSLKCDCQKQNNKDYTQYQIFEYKTQKELEFLMQYIQQACIHNPQCIHEQLFEKNQQNKKFRQLCDFRIDWTKLIIKAEKQFEKAIVKKQMAINYQPNNDCFKIIILEAINNKENSLKMLIDKSKQELQFIEYAKRLAIKLQQKLDCPESLLCQFEDVQNRKKYIHPPSIWSIMNCSCNTTSII
ncbi:unnamed protein product [Paramecium pentaurelia]|uniref:Uncharacterized protein n=1 Tax=Paramecium pentaurelia TaxID=43138 RepID=A0A8S1UK82_9CILI|nr:unnamed protein product [Paramecium pentaurelia]